MLLLVGLGNPGAEYAAQRHNVGFMAVDAIHRRHGFGPWRRRFNAAVAEGTLAGEKVHLLKPQTYMNEAGDSVGPARGAFKVPLDRVLVIHDEIDLPFGEIRTRTGGGLAGHNGLKSLKAGLGSADFARVRIGVGRPPTTDPDRVAAYVLGRFREPRADVQALIEEAADVTERAIVDAAAGDLDSL